MFIILIQEENPHKIDTAKTGSVCKGFHTKEEALAEVEFRYRSKRAYQIVELNLVRSDDGR
jgi:hypothetical protein